MPRDDSAKNEDDIDKDEIARLNEEWLKKHLDADAEFSKGGETVCILFADLAGSTAFKARHKPVVGMEKVYTHNRCVEEVVESEEFEGEVAKFLGDGVLAFFEGDDAAQRGLKAALAIVTRIHEENDKRGWEFPKAMFTRVGLAFGPVWMMQFKTAVGRDPQGTTVDIAARLASLAGSNQVLATQILFDAAGGKDEFPDSRITETCTVRGLREPIQLVTVALPGETAERAVLPGGFPAANEQTGTLLKSAADHWRKSQQATEDKDQQKAEEELKASIKDYEKVLSDDVLNFEANFNLALHLSTHMRNHKEKRSERLERAISLLQVAVSERPGSCYAWKWLSWVRFRQFRESSSRSVDFLDEAIRYAGHACHIAESNQNDHGAAISKIFLVIYLNMRLSHAKTKKQRAHDLQQAQDYIEQLRIELDGGPGKWLESRLQVGESLTGLATGKYDEPSARELLKQAYETDPDNLLAVELMVDSLQGLLMDGSQ